MYYLFNFHEFYKAVMAFRQSTKKKLQSTNQSCFVKIYKMTLVFEIYLKIKLYKFKLLSFTTDITLFSSVC